jgi:hypothetical protein
MPPSGTVTFTNSSSNQVLGSASLAANGVATITTAFSAAGTYTITTTYNGDGNYTGSNGSLSQQVVAMLPTIAVAGGNGQSAPISTAFPTNLAAIVRDGSNNPLAGAVVTFSAPGMGASGTFAGGITTITATTNTSGIATASIFTANGTVGSYSVLATTSGANASAIFNLVNNPANVASGYTYYLPFLANTVPTSSGTGSFTTYLAFQNSASVSTTVTLSYYDANGNIVATSVGTCSSVPAFGECTPPNPFAVGQRGEAILTSLQPLNVIVSEATPFGGSAYAAVAGASHSLIAPVAIHNGLGDFTTQLNVFNGGSTTATGTIQFYDQNGNHVAAADKNFNLAAHTTSSFDQLIDSTLGSSFYGWAQISGVAGSELVAQVLEQSPSIRFVAVVNAQFNPQTTLYAPAIFNQAFGPFVTGANLVNPNSTPVSVTVSYYKNDGTLFAAAPFTITGYGVQGIYQGAANGVGLPSGGLPHGWSGSAQVSVVGSQGIVMFVNEQGGTTASGGDQSGTYSAAASGGTVIGLPVMANGAFGGYITGATIENSSNGTVGGTIQYYDVSGNTVGAAQPFNIDPHASYSVYQGSSGLPSGFYGTAIISVTSGPSSSLLVTTNAQSNAFFYSYTEAG